MITEVLKLKQAFKAKTGKAPRSLYVPKPLIEPLARECVAANRCINVLTVLGMVVQESSGDTIYLSSEPAPRKTLDPGRGSTDH